MLKILILEDDPISALVWKLCIRSIAHHAEISIYPSLTAVIGQYRTLQSAAQKYDLLVVDLFLSGDSMGFEILKQLDSHLLKRVIFSSSISQDLFYRHCSDEKRNVHFLNKPIDYRKCENVLNRFFGDKVRLERSGSEDQSVLGLRSIIEKQYYFEKKRMPVVFVTGCSSGIGLALAERLIRDTSFRLVLTARAESFRDLQMRFKESDRIVLLQMDLTKTEDITYAKDFVLQKWGRIDVLVNVAGCCYRTVVEHMDEESEIRQMKTNYLGPMALIRAVLPVMRESGHGKIINVSSASGLVGMPTMASYSATKHALEAASESLWYELKSSGVSVTVFRPGFINSDGHKRVLTSEKARAAYDLRGPYVCVYNFMNQLVSRFMKLAPKGNNELAEELLALIRKRDLPLWYNATFDVWVIDFVFRFFPRRFVNRVIEFIFTTKINQENLNLASNATQNELLDYL